MAVVAAGPGVASFGVFALAGLLRIADLATTDGTTRTSINAAYQVVQVEDGWRYRRSSRDRGPGRDRRTGMMLLALNALDSAWWGDRLRAGALVMWTASPWASTARIRARSPTRCAAARSWQGRRSPTSRGGPGPAAVRRRPRRAPRPGSVAGVASPARRRAPPGRRRRGRGSARACAGSASPLLGDARSAADASCAGVATSRDSSIAVDRQRRRPSAILAEHGLGAGDREMLVTLLEDAELVRLAASLDAVAAADSAAPEIVERVVAAAGEARTAGRATAAIARLGDAAVPPLAAALANADARRRLRGSYARRPRPPRITASRSSPRRWATRPLCRTRRA